MLLADGSSYQSSNVQAFHTILVTLLEEKCVYVEVFSVSLWCFTRIIFFRANESQGMVDFRFIPELLWIHHLAQGGPQRVTCSEALLTRGWSTDYSASVGGYQQPDSDPKLVFTIGPRQLQIPAPGRLKQNSNSPSWLCRACYQA